MEVAVIVPLPVEPDTMIVSPTANDETLPGETIRINMYYDAFRSFAK